MISLFARNVPRMLVMFSRFTLRKLNVNSPILNPDYSEPESELMIVMI